MKRKSTTRLGFILEDRLLFILKKTVASWVTPKKCEIVFSSTKFAVGMIVPDLVLIAVPKDSHPTSASRQALSLFECAVLAELLHCGPRSSEQIATRLYARPATLERAVVRLTRHELLSTGKKGILSARRRAFPASLRVISIEAKLRRWKEAIQQAKSYLQFSNTSYVALPWSVIEKNERIKLACAAEGVGLIAVTSNSTHILLRPKNFKPLTAERIWLIKKTAAIAQSKSNGAGVHKALVTSRRRSKA